MNPEGIDAAAELDYRLEILGRCECGDVRDVREIPIERGTYLEPFCPGCGVVPDLPEASWPHTR